MPSNPNQKTCLTVQEETTEIQTNRSKNISIVTAHVFTTFMLSWLFNMLRYLLFYVNAIALETSHLEHICSFHIIWIDHFQT